MHIASRNFGGEGASIVEFTPKFGRGLVPRLRRDRHLWLWMSWMSCVAQPVPDLQTQGHCLIHTCMGVLVSRDPRRHKPDEKALRETQTLHAGCSKAEPKMFAPPQTPFPGARDGQNSISWRWSLPLPTNPVWWRSMHAISSYRGNRPTNKHTNAATNPQIRRQDRLQYTAPLSLARSVNIY